ncbi:lipocalin family protein [Riemerella anatipestifer]|nr:lipocalin family protein [Riemerella anatipestifer]MDY3534222.1 lipocalin family protein [Riemerella anatipestifer]MDY3536275.1 lipocalin family protein [Riemerella anatipestifer]
MRKILLTFALICLFISCSRDENNAALNGTFSEITPIGNRTKMNFKSQNILSIIKPDSSDDFNYQIDGNKIHLSNNMGYKATLEFVKISDNEFKIENLYVSIPEYPKSYISFRK